MKKKSKKKIKYVEPPMKWNPGAHKYEVDLPVGPEPQVEVERQEVSLWKFILFVVLILLLTGLGGWLISLLF